MLLCYKLKQCRLQRVISDVVEEFHGRACSRGGEHGVGVFNVGGGPRDRDELRVPRSPASSASSIVLESYDSFGELASDVAQQSNNIHRDYARPTLRSAQSSLIPQKYRSYKTILARLDRLGPCPDYICLLVFKIPAFHHLPVSCNAM